MSDTLTPIDVKSEASKLVHAIEQAKDVSTWFKDETIELNFGETTGRPDSDITLQREYLARFLETGWTIDEVLEQGDSGSWVATGGSRTTNKNATLSARVGANDFTNVDDDLTAIASPRGRLISAVSTKDQGSPLEKNTDRPIYVSISESTPLANAPAYWTSYQKIRLKRRRLQPEVVLQSMVTSFTDAYNAGRKIDDDHYNEVVSLYSLMLNRTESEGNALVASATDLQGLLDEIKSKVLVSLDTSDTAAKDVSDRVLKVRIDEINRQYDALVSQAKAQMITSGLYTTTVWPSTRAGIERTRAEALDKANAEASQTVFSTQKTLSELNGTVGVQLLQTAQAMATAADQRKITVTEMRNSVLKWMLDFIGARQESYPELEELSTVTERLGFSVGSAGNVL